MANILILGAGVMGSALSVPACDNGHDVFLVGSPLDSDIINAVHSHQPHPTLFAPLPNAVKSFHYDTFSNEPPRQFDAVILGVSSAGITWALAWLVQQKLQFKRLALVTKGLVTAGLERPLTFAEAVPARLRQAGLRVDNIIGIGGPCIAREIVFRQPTSVIYACDDTALLTAFAGMMRTPHYRIRLTHDVVGVEACAALKNLLAIGVSASMGQYTTQKNGQDLVSKNPTAALFNQAVHELGQLAVWLGGERASAFDLAGLGDLHVTVGGGRNSRLGVLLGSGLSLQQALDGPLSGETVEGVDTGRILATALHHSLEKGELQRAQLPLTLAIVAALETNQPFKFDFEQL